MYEMTGRVRYSEVGPDGRLTLFAMINYFQDCCTEQSELLGIGVSFLKAQDLAWFIVSWQVRIRELPLLGTPIRVATRLNMEGLFGARDFYILTIDGEELVHAHSIWMLMNTEKGIPIRIPSYMGDKYVYDPELRSNTAGRKIPVPGGLRSEEPVEIHRYLLDTNDHMNNGQYVRLAEEYLPEGFPVRGLRVEYKNEAHAGDLLHPRTGNAEDRVTVVLTDGAEKVYAVVEFRSDEDKLEVS